MKIEKVKKVFDGRIVGSVNGLYVTFNSDENVSKNDIYTLYIEGVRDPYEFSVKLGQMEKHLKSQQKDKMKDGMRLKLI